jgi:hypothetical protein
LSEYFNDWEVNEAEFLPQKNVVIIPKERAIRAIRTELSLVHGMFLQRGKYKLARQDTNNAKEVPTTITV